MMAPRLCVWGIALLASVAFIAAVDVGAGRASPQAALTSNPLSEIEEILSMIKTLRSNTKDQQEKEDIVFLPAEQKCATDFASASIELESTMSSIRSVKDSMVVTTKALKIANATVLETAANLVNVTFGVDAVRAELSSLIDEMKLRAELDKNKHSYLKAKIMSIEAIQTRLLAAFASRPSITIENPEPTPVNFVEVSSLSTELLQHHASFPVLPVQKYERLKHLLDVLVNSVRDNQKLVTERLAASASKPNATSGLLEEKQGLESQEASLFARRNALIEKLSKAQSSVKLSKQSLAHGRAMLRGLKKDMGALRSKLAKMKGICDDKLLGYRQDTKARNVQRVQWAGIVAITEAHVAAIKTGSAVVLSPEDSPESLAKLVANSKGVEKQLAQQLLKMAQESSKNAVVSNSSDYKVKKAAKAANTSVATATNVPGCGFESWTPLSPCKSSKSPCSNGFRGKACLNRAFLYCNYVRNTPLADAHCQDPAVVAALSSMVPKLTEADTKEGPIASEEALRIIKAAAASGATGNSLSGLTLDKPTGATGAAPKGSTGSTGSTGPNDDAEFEANKAAAIANATAAKRAADDEVAGKAAEEAAAVKNALKAGSNNTAGQVAAAGAGPAAAANMEGSEKWCLFNSIHTLSPCRVGNPCATDFTLPNCLRSASVYCQSVRGRQDDDNACKAPALIAKFAAQNM